MDSAARRWEQDRVPVPQVDLTQHDVRRPAVDAVDLASIPALARLVTVSSVRHLAQRTDVRRVQSVTFDTGMTFPRLGHGVDEEMWR
jgi:hypothetical protein